MPSPTPTQASLTAIIELLHGLQLNDPKVDQFIRALEWIAGTGYQYEIASESRPRRVINFPVSDILNSRVMTILSEHWEVARAPVLRELLNGSRNADRYTLLAVVALRPGAEIQESVEMRQLLFDSASDNCPLGRLLAAYGLSKLLGPGVRSVLDSLGNDPEPLIRAVVHRGPAAVTNLDACRLDGEASAWFESTVKRAALVAGLRGSDQQPGGGAFSAPEVDGPSPKVMRVLPTDQHGPRPVVLARLARPSSRRDVPRRPCTDRPRVEEAPGRLVFGLLVPLTSSALTAFLLVWRLRRRK